MVFSSGVVAGDDLHADGPGPMGNMVQNVLHHCYFGLSRCCVPASHVQPAHTTCFFGTIYGAARSIAWLHWRIIDATATAFRPWTTPSS